MWNANDALAQTTTLIDAGYGKNTSVRGPEDREALTTAHQSLQQAVALSGKKRWQLLVQAEKGLAIFRRHCDNEHAARIAFDAMRYIDTEPGFSTLDRSSLGD